MTHAEKRREPRNSANGNVQIRFANPATTEIDGRLLDISAGGFRMSHDFVSLEAGQVVEFSHAAARGQARVIWNRILEQRVETGFLVIK